MHPIVFRLACLALLAGVLALMVQESGKSTSRATWVFDTLQTIDDQIIFVCGRIVCQHGQCMFFHFYQQFNLTSNVWLQCLYCVCHLRHQLHSNPRRRDPSSAFLLKVSSLLMKGVILSLWGTSVRRCHNIWPVKPFGPGTVIRGYTYSIDLTCCGFVFSCRSGGR